MKKTFTKLLSLALLLGFLNPVEVSAQCPTISNVVFPPSLNVSDDELDFSTYTDELSPENLVLNYGYSEADSYATWLDLDNCENLSYSFENTLININGTSFKILRAWTVLDWLTGDVSANYQIIKNIVDLGSQSYCLNQQTISVNPWTCSGFVVSPEFFLLSGFNYQNVSMTPAATTEFGIGIHNIVVNATLGSETIECNSTLFVIDNTPPVVIAKESVYFMLDSDCTGTLTPEIIDNGSHDGDCGGVTLSVAPSYFTDADAGTTVTVYLTAVDEAGNSNYTWSEVTIAACGASSFSCLQVVSVANLNDNGIQLYATDFLTSSSTSSGDLSLTITDPSGNLITNGFLPQGSGGSFLYTVTDNVTGETCSGVIQVPLPYTPCIYLACQQSVYTTLPESGGFTFYATDFALNVENCTDLVIDIFDEDSNLLLTGASVTLDQSGTYMYQITNSEGNSCWGSLFLTDYVPCPASIACNSYINVSMYVPSGNTTPIAVINSEMLLEGNVSGCDIDNYMIEINDTGIAGYYFSGTGSVEVNQPSIYTYTITDTEGNNCWGTLDIQIITACPGLDIVVFPPNLDLTIVGLTGANLFQELAPESLVGTYGYSIEETLPTWSIVFGCDNLFYTYEDQLFDFNDGSFKILRTWSVLDWLTGNVSQQVQIIKNNINQGLICDFLPNSAIAGDCASGHTYSDDVEWPDDIAIADYRIKPSGLVAFSQIDYINSQPIIVNNEDIYEIEYIDILKQLQVNLITINRVWTVSANGINTATYTQVIEVDITGFASLVAVNTMFQRPVPGVELAPSEFTNEIGVGFPSSTDNLEPYKSDVHTNGVTIKDLIMVHHHILGIATLNDLQLLAADVSLDEQVSGIDLVSIRKSIIEVGPLTYPDWFFIEAPETENTINPKEEYIAIKPGDVDDDADLGFGILLETGTMELEDVLINNGENYQTRLQYAGEDLSLGAEVHLYYDASLITVNNLYVENPEMNLEFNLDIPGEIHLTLGNFNSLGFLFAGENLINIEFTAASNGLLSQAIEGTSPRDSYLLGLDYELVILEVEVVDQIDTETKDISSHTDLFKVYPNPVSDNLNFDFINGTPNDFKVQLFTITGELISEHKNQTTIDVNSLASGMHFYRLIQDGQAYSGRIDVIK